MRVVELLVTAKDMDEIADRALYIKYDLIPLTREDKELTDKLRDYMVENEIQMIARLGGVIVLRPVNSRRFNIDRFKHDHAELYEEYREMSTCNQVWKTPDNKVQETMRETPQGFPLLPPPPEFL
jgi:predicted phage-related endonuclease